MPKPAKHDKPKNPFKDIKLLNQAAAGGLILPKLAPAQDEGNPKKRLLHDISAAISYSEKANLRNHTLVKVKIIKKEISVGEKVNKLFKTKKDPLHTKTSVRNQFDVALYGREQTTVLLKKIKKRIEADKSDPLDFDALNADIKALHGHYQDKVILQDASLDHKAAVKSMRKIETELKKTKSPTQEEGKNSATQALKKMEDQKEKVDDKARYIEGYKEKVKKWQKAHPKPKSKLDKVIDIATEPLIPSLKQAPQKPNKGDEAKKHDAAHAHSVANKMRSGFNADGGEQSVSGNIAPSPGMVAHVKVAKGEGQGR